MNSPPRKSQSLTVDSWLCLRCIFQQTSKRQMTDFLFRNEPFLHVNELILSFSELAHFKMSTETIKRWSEWNIWACRVRWRGVWTLRTQTAAYFPHLSAVSSLWGNCSYVWVRRKPQLYYTNIVTCPPLYIWTHLKLAYWKFFLSL